MSSASLYAGYPGVDRLQAAFCRHETDDYFAGREGLAALADTFREPATYTPWWTCPRPVRRVLAGMVAAIGLAAAVSAPLVSSPTMPAGAVLGVGALAVLVAALALLVDEMLGTVARPASVARPCPDLTGLSAQEARILATALTLTARRRPFWTRRGAHDQTLRRRAAVTAAVQLSGTGSTPAVISGTVLTCDQLVDAALATSAHPG